MPTGFHTGARPANTYILPPAAAPEISSAGSGNGASFTQLPWAQAADAAQIAPAITMSRQASRPVNRGIPFSLQTVLELIPPHSRIRNRGKTGDITFTRQVLTRSPSGQTEPVSKWLLQHPT